MIKHALCISVFRHDTLRRAKDHWEELQSFDIEDKTTAIDGVHLHTKARMGYVPILAVVVDEIC